MGQWIPTTNLGKVASALAWCASRPGQTVRRVTRGLAGVCRDRLEHTSPIPTVALSDLVGSETVNISDGCGRDGNVTLNELVAICSLVRHRAPRVLVEIGTFDGNTTRHMAMNSPDDARVYTLDLPPQGTASERVCADDHAYIADTAKQDHKYAHIPEGRKVVQCLGDSATFDFATMCEHGPPQLAFIDGAHSYEYARNDTRKILDVLAPGGIVLWHDYKPIWPGVVRWLDELSRELPLQRIAGTSLIYLDAARANGTT